MPSLLEARLDEVVDEGSAHKVAAQEGATVEPGRAPDAPEPARGVSARRVEWISEVP